MNRRLTEEHASAYWEPRLQALEQEPLAFGMYPEERRSTMVGAAARAIMDQSGFIMGEPRALRHGQTCVDEENMILRF